MNYQRVKVNKKPIKFIFFNFVYYNINVLLKTWCSLETWYFMALVLFAGYLKNAEIAVDALSIWLVLFLIYYYYDDNCCLFCGTKLIF